MGMIVDTGQGFTIEDRRESLYLHYPEDEEMERHFFAYGEGTLNTNAYRMVEISKDYLRRLKRFLDAHPEVLEDR